MPFHEGMGDKRVPGAKKRGFARAGQEFNAELREQGPGAIVLPEEIPTYEPGSGRRGKLRGSKTAIDRKSSYGLPSISELNYPEAYKPVSTTFWEGLSDQQRSEVMRLQAVAQEKVGYEKGTTKYFMQDFDAEEAQSADPELRLVALAAPRLVAGGILIGAGAAVTIIGMAGVLPAPQAIGLGSCAVLGGLAMLMLSR
jgi:hypothetical protein